MARRIKARDVQGLKYFDKLAPLLERLHEVGTERGLTEDELAIFDLLSKDKLGKTERERVKQASRSLLEKVQVLIAPLERWTDKEQTQAEVETCILDYLYEALPTPPFTEEEKQEVAQQVYRHVWRQSMGQSPIAA